MKNRCTWCGSDPLYVAYHDTEWGVPLHDDRLLFQLLILEGAQAGLSWLTILRRREQYIKAFEGFDCQRMARYTQADVQRLLAEPGIIRNRLKITSAIRNARAVLGIQERYGSLDAYLWQYVDGEPIQNQWTCVDDVPDQTDLSQRISREMNKLGICFFGPVICYAFMQAVGMVNDHTVDCFRHREIVALATS
ncbi:DNA-3-methyladenine glycosylase I [Desulfoplanes formicivorans]|uniref:DNA-3-methyladenine glycosylase I n=1 Tax=Desulfoplanes formicivorans TaxID=1592317 RepID=A0A194AID0_9BACT|nr:DNA-3-methyladenine glycosylase I [Desulfoplanes formicivorans]GAU08514.1 DNA-3-methyladenine glycosylase I [Desulfoplanes formicivorans]